jgi:hypothetical protein
MIGHGHLTFFEAPSFLQTGQIATVGKGYIITKSNVVDAILSEQLKQRSPSVGYKTSGARWTKEYRSINRQQTLT